jgi:HEAT repeat protein
MVRWMKPFLAGCLAFGLIALTMAPQLLAETKDAEAKKWTEKLKSAKDAKVRAEAIEHIGKLAQINKSLGEAALPDIKTALKDKDKDVRKSAAHAYGQCDPDDSDAVSSLIELLKNDPSDDVKLSAAKGLAALGKKAKDAVDPLKAAAKAAGKGNDKVYKDAIKTINDTKKKA